MLKKLCAIRLRLFLEWGITFGEPYQVPERAARKVAYASKLELETAILQRRQSAAERPTESPPPPPEPAAPGEKYGPNRAREELDKLHPSGSRLKDLKESEEETT